MIADHQDLHARLDPTGLLMVAGVLVGAAIQIRLGRFDGLALGMAVAGTLLVATALAAWRHPGAVTDTRLRRGARVVLAVHVLSLVPLLRAASAGAGSSIRAAAGLAAVVGAVLAWDQLRAVPSTGAWGRGGLVAALGVLGLLWIAAVPTNIDVFHYQDIGTQRLLEGINPYAPGYPNPYDGSGTDAFFGAGLSADGVLQFGFPYPPLSLFLALPGALLGDVRVAHLLAVMTAGWLLLSMVEDSWASRAGGVLFLTTPMLLPLVQRAWTEAFLILAVVALVWVLRRGSGADAVALGLFVAVKQYAAMFLPILLVAAPHWRTASQRWRALAVAVAVATVVTLPLALWDVGDFLFSVVLLQFRQPFREDAMSLPALAERTLGWSGETLALPGIVIAVAVATGWVLRRSPRTWPAAATGMALVMLAFLLFNKQAFTNYYMLALAMVWLAVALHDDARRRAQAPLAPPPHPVSTTRRDQRLDPRRVRSSAIACGTGCEPPPHGPTSQKGSPMADTPSMRVDDTTREAERHDAQAAPSGGPQPTPEEEAAAERAAPADPEVSGNYEEYLELGAEQEGEGRMDVADDGRPPQVP